MGAFADISTALIHVRSTGLAIAAALGIACRKKITDTAAV
jgi:hypothetical protein